MNITQAIPLADAWGMHGNVGWGWMVFMMALMVLFWGALIFGIVWLIRASFDRRPAEPSESPGEILERRFAEGAISVEDYRARREVLIGADGANGARKEEPLTAPQEAGAKR